MNFFEVQKRAKEQSELLYQMSFGLFVVTFAATYFAILNVASRFVDSDQPIQFVWNQQVFIATAIFVGGALLIGYFQRSSMASSGESVALFFGGREVLPTTHVHHEKVLLNVVEEMAIASNLPIPKVFILDRQTGINAFAAGYDYKSAVVAVTEGCLRELDRDELQAVIGHEFSHIAHLDMSLNLKLLILVGSYLGLFDMGRALARFNRRSDSSSKGGGQIAIFGLGFMAIGLFGLLMGRILQSAFSRKREFLADATSAQYTRNPEALARALKKIKEQLKASVLKHPSSQDIAHMMFVSNQWIGNIFATHPPIEERLRALVARPDEIQIKDPRAEALPEQAQRNSQDSLGAMATIVSLLGGVSGLSNTGKQIESLISQEILHNSLNLEALSKKQKFILIEKSLRSILSASKEQQLEFLSTLEKHIFADGQLELLEVCILVMVRTRLLTPRALEAKSPLSEYSLDIYRILYHLSLYCHKDPSERMRMLKFELDKFSLRLEMFSSAQSVAHLDLKDSLIKVSRADIGLRQRVIASAIRMIQLDAMINDDEFILIKVISFALDLPLSPSVLGQIKN